MLASLALFLMIRLVGIRTQSASSEASNKNDKPHWHQLAQWVLLGTVIGLGLLTKEGTIGLLPLAWGTTFIVSWQEDEFKIGSRSGSHTVRLLKILGKSILIFILILIPVLLIAGWWYYRNIQLYGDWLGWSAFIAVLGERGHPASLGQLWGERRGFLMSYWGLFGGVNLPMPNWIYTFLNSLLIVSLVGFTYFLLRLIRQWLRDNKEHWRTVFGAINNLLSFISTNFALIVCLLFATAVVFGLIQWATTTWSSQGRLVFTALSALSVLFTAGLVGWLPQRSARWAIGLIGSFLFIIATLAPFLWIRPNYQSAIIYTSPTHMSYTPKTRHLATVCVFGESLSRRNAYPEHQSNNQPSGESAGTSSLQPGDTFWVHLDWEMLQEVEEDWSVFVHLIDPVLGQPIAQRDMYLGQGLLLTSWLESGDRLVNSYQLTVPETAIAPAQLDLAVGLYNFKTGERLPIDEGRDLAVIAKLNLAPRDGDTPNPILINFEDEMQLSGFERNPRRILPGDTIDLTLYWQAQQQLEKEYTIFAQVIDDDTTRWASIDLKPSDGTKNWQPGQIMPLELSLTIDENAPPGLYPLIVGLYTQDSQGDFNRLQILTADGRLTDDFLELTQIRIE